MKTEGDEKEAQRGGELSWELSAGARKGSRNSGKGWLVFLVWPVNRSGVLQHVFKVSRIFDYD